jgi:hypothetical protein
MVAGGLGDSFVVRWSSRHCEMLMMGLLATSSFRSSEMGWHRLRLTIRGSMAVVALLALVLTFGLVPLLKEIERRRRAAEYGQVAVGMTNAIFALENRAPRGVNPANWKSAVKLTAVAHFNAFHLFHPPTIEELYRSRDELMAKLRGPVDLQTLEWTWARIARTGIDGKSITDQHQREFEECLAPGTMGAKPDP